MSATPTNLKVALIGGGSLGEPLARLFTQAGHTVKIANSRGPDSLADVAQRTGATAATVEEAVDRAHVVVVAVPLARVPQLDKNLFMSLPSTTLVVDANNYYPQRDGRIAELDGSDAAALVESRWVETHLGRPVLKALNTIDAYSLAQRGQPAGAAGRIALPIAGADAIHKATLIALLDQLGFDGVDTGGIEGSWRQQPGTPVYCTNLDVEGVRRGLARTDRNKSAALRDEAWERLMASIKAGESWEGLYQMSRELVEKAYKESE